MRQPSEQQRFSHALRKVLQVSKSDLHQMLEEEKRLHIGKTKRGPKPKILDADRASGDKG